MYVEHFVVIIPRMTAGEVKKELCKLADKKKAKVLQGFFKTGPGEYGEGDVFLGVTVPKTRGIVKRFLDLPFPEIRKLLRSEVHEERLAAVLMLVHRFEAGDTREQKKIYDFYLRNTKQVNNWDLVDLSAHKIVGAYLLKKNKAPLYRLVKSKDLWERRISIVATAKFISENKFSDTLRISKLLLDDEHDLIHKAVGWMLREVGKRDLAAEEEFLKKHYRKMPRTMLRYAIEKFPEKKRRKYLKGLI